MNTKTSKRSRSRASLIAAKKARLAKLDVKREREKDGIRALEAVDKLVSRKAESRDKVLIGIAALAAARTDPAVKMAIDAAIRGLSERERAHLDRDGSLWAELGAQAPDDARPTEMAADPRPVPEPGPVTVDDPDMAPISFKPEEKRLWEWYEDWDDHKSIFSAMRMERNSSHYWVAKTGIQQQALALLGRHPEVRFNGMNTEETEQCIYEACEREAAEPDPEPRAPQELMAAYLQQRVGKPRSRKRPSGA